MSVSSVGPSVFFQHKEIFAAAFWHHSWLSWRGSKPSAHQIGVIKSQQMPSSVSCILHLHSEAQPTCRWCQKCNRFFGMESFPWSHWLAPFCCISSFTLMTLMHSLAFWSSKHCLLVHHSAESEPFHWFVFGFVRFSAFNFWNSAVWIQFFTVNWFCPQLICHDHPVKRKCTATEIENFKGLEQVWRWVHGRGVSDCFSPKWKHTSQSHMCEITNLCHSFQTDQHSLVPHCMSWQL